MPSQPDTLNLDFKTTKQRKLERWQKILTLDFGNQFPSANGIISFQRNCNLKNPPGFCMQHQLRQSLQPRRPTKPYTKACNLRRRWVNLFLSFNPSFLPAFLSSFPLPDASKSKRNQEGKFTSRTTKRSSYDQSLCVKFHLTFKFKSKRHMTFSKTKNKCQLTFAFF